VSLQADYYDGKSARRIAVVLAPLADTVVLSGEGVERSVPLSQVRISERLGSAPRLISFADGAHAEVRDHAGFELWLKVVGHRERPVDLLQRSWIAAGISMLLVAIAVFIGYRWGLPLMAEKISAHMPDIVVRRMSDHVLDLLDGHVFKDSGLPTERQQKISAAFAALAGEQYADTPVELLFRASPGLGANALALPDGRIVLLDGLVDLADNDEQILAVLGHELGHVHYRHNLHALVQGAAISAVLAWWIGDFSSVIAAAPAAVMQARYSQALESEADAFAASLLKAHGLSPELLAQMLEKLQASADKRKEHAEVSAPAPKADDKDQKQKTDDDYWRPYLSTHPATQERIRALREAE
jgi:Zn-dependent protease with chaperone function